MDNVDEVDNVDDTTITVSCGNVFLDAGLPEPHERLIKADLILCLRRVIYGVGGRKTAAKRRRACERTGLHEGQLIQVLDNKDHCCSIDQIGELLFRLGYVVDVQIRPREMVVLGRWQRTVDSGVLRPLVRRDA